MSDSEAFTSLQTILGQCFWDNVSLFIWSTGIQKLFQFKTSNFKFVKGRPKQLFGQSFIWKQPPVPNLHSI